MKKFILTLVIPFISLVANAETKESEAYINPAEFKAVCVAKHEHCIVRKDVTDTNLVKAFTVRKDDLNVVIEVVYDFWSEEFTIRDSK